MKYILLMLLASFKIVLVSAQDLHFSQFYNSPLLVNVANTALMSNREFRIFSQYRSQWNTLPAPFTTMVAGGDVQLLRGDRFTNWLGFGFYGVSDRAGDGLLALNQYGLTLAYHVLINESNLISVGFGSNYNTRFIDFSRLSYDLQWDGFTFNRILPNGESRFQAEQSQYYNVQAGVNYSFFPNESSYFKIGFGMTNINRPNVSLMSNNDIRLSYRSIGSFDAILQLKNGWYFSPSAYYTRMQKAQELTLGVQVQKDLEAAEATSSAQIIFGTYLRVNESFITVIGIDWGNLKITSSFDYTISSLAKANKGNGALEFSIIYQGFYTNSKFNQKSPFRCPRF